MRTFRWALLALIAFLSPHPVHAQDGSAETYSLVVRGAPLSTALEALVARTRMDLAYDPPLVRNKRATCAIENASAEQILRCVLKGTGVDFYRLSSGLYVLTKTPETVPLYGGLQGVVVDAETRQPLPRSHVMLADRASGTTSNDAGMFAFSRLPPGRYVVMATHVGYRSSAIAVQVPPGGDTRAELALEADPILVQPIVVDGLEWRLPSEKLGSASLEQDELAENPAGAAEVLSGLNSLLGVRVSDATADIHVQGGETGEHQLRLDGAPVFLPLNFASFVGPFSPFAIGNITVHKAGFSASEGSQISGVIDVRHDVNFSEKRGVDVQVDPLSANARVNLRGGKGRDVQTSFMAAGRTSIWGLYAPPALENLLHRWNATDPFLFTLFDRSRENPRFQEADTTTGNPVIGFRDLHAATRVRFGALQSLHASAYFGRTRLGSDLARQDAGAAGFDALGPVDAETIRDLFTWDTGIGQARYEAVVGSKTLASLGARGSYYRVRHDYSVPDTAEVNAEPGRKANDALEIIDDGNRIYEFALEGRLDYALNDRHSLATGLELIETDSRFDILGTQRFPIHHRSDSRRVAAYLEDEVTVTRRLSADVGSRATYLSTRNTVYAEPRAALRYDRETSIIGPFSARLSTGLYRQYISQFDVSSRSPRALISDTRFWLASDSTLSPPRATHYAAELLFKPWSAWSIRFEGFVKQQHRILAVDYQSEGARTGAELPQDAFLRQNRGSVRGASALLRHDFRAGRAEIRYEFVEVERKSDSLFLGLPTSTPWNEPHRVELAFDYAPLDNLTLLVRWRGVWGRTWGFRQSYYDFVGAFNTIAPDLTRELIGKAQRQIDRYRLAHPEEHELPPIYQLDLSAAYSLRTLGSRFQVRFDVLNVLNRENVAEWHLVYDPETYFTGEEQGFLQMQERPLLPRVISVAVKWSW